jgi:hypothetical protein
VRPNSPETPELTIKKKSKRLDAHQSEALNTVFVRTPYPSTEERQQLAMDLDMSARSVQIWLAHAFIYIKCLIPELLAICLGSKTKGSGSVEADEILPALQPPRPL